MPAWRIVCRLGVCFPFPTPCSGFMSTPPRVSSSAPNTSLTVFDPHSLLSIVSDATRTVLERRFRVLLLVRDAYEHLTQHAPVLSSVRDDLTTMLRLVYAWANRSYRRIPWSPIALIVAALCYFVLPVDLVPDLLGPIGLTDDVVLISSVVQSARSELDRFRSWENRRGISEGQQIMDGS